MSRKYELSDDSVIVVIGSGAGGGTISRELTTAGIDVVCLEAGSHIGPIVTDSQKMFGRLTWLDGATGEKRGEVELSEPARDLVTLDSMACGCFAEALNHLSKIRLGIACDSSRVS